MAGETIGRSAAVRLLVACARQVRPDFTVTSANAVAVAELCRRLDGIPLALELAAAQLRLLTPAALLRRLGTGLDRSLDLAASAVDTPDRQRTLRATIRWSYSLLGEAERVPNKANKFDHVVSVIFENRSFDNPLDACTRRVRSPLSRVERQGTLEPDSVAGGTRRRAVGVAPKLSAPNPDSGEEFAYVSIQVSLRPGCRGAAARRGCAARPGRRGVRR